MQKALKQGIILTVVALLAACARTPAPAPAPRPVVVAPPPPVYIPPRPLPPGGAPVAMAIPAIGLDGVRMTPNRDLGPEEAVWHFRSALNVAALSCQGPAWTNLATNYNSMLKAHKKRLAQIDKAMDARYRKQYPGQNALRLRDTKLTDLYNYFALPPVKGEYCNLAAAKGEEALAIPSDRLEEYAATALNDIDAVFIRFFNAYADYEVAVADWDQRYGQRAQLADPLAATYSPSAFVGPQPEG